MTTIITILFLILNAYLVYMLRAYLHDTLEFKRAKATEIKRRLQVEAKADAVWKEKFALAENNGERIRDELQANRERHERTVKYVLQDVFERHI